MILLYKNNINNSDDTFKKKTNYYGLLAKEAVGLYKGLVMITFTYAFRKHLLYILI